MTDNDDVEKRKQLAEPLIGKDTEDETRASTTGHRGGPPRGPGGPPFHFDDSKELTYGGAMKRIFMLGLWPMIGNMFHPAYHICNSIILGQKTDPLLQSAYGLGNIVISVFLLCLSMSFNGSLDTLISQAFGQRDQRLCWVYLNRQLYLTTILYLILSTFLFIMCEPMLIALGQDPALTEQAVMFVRICIPGIICGNWGNAFSRFMSGQRVMIINMYAVIGSTIIHIPMAWFLSIYLGWDMYGIAIASSFQFASRFFICIAYILISGKFKEHYVSLLHPDCFKNWKSQFIIGVHAASLGIWAFIAFDMFSLIASYLSIAELAAQTILRNIGVLTYMIPFAIAQASGILTGNMIGAKNLQAARILIRTSSMTGIIWSFLSIAFVNIFATPLTDLFSNVFEVREAALAAYFMFSCFIFVDCLQGVIQGLIRGLGRQGRASIFTFTGYWILGIPISLVCVFYYDMGLTGLWTGITVGVIFNTISYYAIVYTSDLEKIALEADLRRQKEFEREKKSGTIN